MNFNPQAQWTGQQTPPINLKRKDKKKKEKKEKKKTKESEWSVHEVAAFMTCMKYYYCNI